MYICFGILNIDSFLPAGQAYTNRQGKTSGEAQFCVYRPTIGRSTGRRVGTPRQGADVESSEAFATNCSEWENPTSWWQKVGNL